MQLSEKMFRHWTQNLLGAIQNGALVTANTRKADGTIVPVLACIIPQTLSRDGVEGSHLFVPLAIILGPGEGKDILLPTEEDNPQGEPEPVAPSPLILPSVI